MIRVVTTLQICLKDSGDDVFFIDITYFGHHPSLKAKEPTVFWRMNQSPPSNRKGRGRPSSGRPF